MTSERQNCGTKKEAAVAMQQHVKHVSMVTNKHTTAGSQRSELFVSECRVAYLDAATK
jgi:hypothetical protein